MGLRYTLELESRGLVGGREEDKGTIYKKGRNKDEEPNIPFQTRGKVRLEMETVQQM